MVLYAPFIPVHFSLFLFEFESYEISATKASPFRNKSILLPSFLIFSCTFFTPTSNHVATYHRQIEDALSISQLSRKRKHQSFRLAPTRRAFNALENCSGLVFRQETAWRHPTVRWPSGSSRVTLCDWQDVVKEFPPPRSFLQYVTHRSLFSVERMSRHVSTWSPRN